MFETQIEMSGELSAVIIRADGTREDLGVISPARPVAQRAIAALHQPPSFWRKVWMTLRHEGKIPAAMGLGAFIAHSFMHGRVDPAMFAIVTTAGVNYMASDFASGGATPTISGFKFHDMGTGDVHGSTNAITAATNATPIVATRTAHGFGANDIIKITGMTGLTAANAIWQVSPVTANTYTLLGSVGNGAFGGSPLDQQLNCASDTTMTTTAIGSGLAARVTGTPTNPSANQYRSVATLSFTSSLTLVEWGLFSAVTSGTLWDRRWFNTAGAPATTASAALVVSSIGVNSGDSVAVTYTLSVSSGGS